MINYIQVFGERNSGTNYLNNLINKNIDNVETGAKYGWKHGYVINLRNGMFDISKLLIICVFKNPFAWLVSMHNKPHHASQMRLLSFSDFLREEWICYKGTDYFERDLITNPYTEDEEMKMERDPDTGKRCTNVIQLRNKKNEKLLDLNNHTAQIEYVRYEDLLVDPEKFFSKIIDKYNLKTSSTFQNSNQYHGKNVNEKFSRKEYYLKKEYLSNFNSKDLLFVENEINKDYESKIGYNI